MTGTLRLSITRKDSDDRVCGVSYENGDSVELGYWLAEAEWGRGYGGEAARAITAHAFVVSGHGALVAGYAQGNDASRRILEGLAFTFLEKRMTFSKAIGATVPVVRMRLLRSNWERVLRAR